MSALWDVIIVGSGNAALTAGIAACEKGASVLMLEKADVDMAGGNTKYTAGAMRFAYEVSRHENCAFWFLRHILGSILVPHHKTYF